MALSQRISVVFVIFFIHTRKQIPAFPPSRLGSQSLLVPKVTSPNELETSSILSAQSVSWPCQKKRWNATPTQRSLLNYLSECVMKKTVQNENRSIVEDRSFFGKRFLFDNPNFQWKTLNKAFFKITEHNQKKFQMKNFSCW